MARTEFSKKTKLAAFERANGHCERCGNKILTHAEYDHRLPDYLGGDNDLANCVCLCPKCHGRKTKEQDRPAIDKTRRTLEKRAGLRKGRGFDKRWRKKIRRTRLLVPSPTWSRPFYESVDVHDGATIFDGQAPGLVKAVIGEPPRHLEVVRDNRDFQHCLWHQQ